MQQSIHFLSHQLCSDFVKVQRRLLAASIVGMLLITVGCGGDTGPSKSAIKGTVSYNGEPIAEGDITFTPDGSEGTPTSAPIRDGKYATDDRFGIAAGTYRVSIMSYKKADASTNASAVEAPNPGAQFRREQLLPEKFNTNSELEKLTVSGTEGTIEKNYDLKD